MNDNAEYDILAAAEEQARKALENMRLAMTPEDFLKWSQGFRNTASALASLKGEIDQDFTELLKGFQAQQIEEPDDRTEQDPEGA